MYCILYIKEVAHIKLHSSLELLESIGIEEVAIF